MDADKHPEGIVYVTIPQQMPQQQQPDIASDSPPAIILMPVKKLIDVKITTLTGKVQYNVSQCGGVCNPLCNDNCMASTFVLQVIPIQIDPHESVEALRLRIEEVEGIPPHFQRLIFTGKELLDGNMLSAYNVGMWRSFVGYE